MSRASASVGCAMCISIRQTLRPSRLSPAANRSSEWRRVDDSDPCVRSSVAVFSPWRWQKFRLVWRAECRARGARGAIVAHRSKRNERARPIARGVAATPVRSSDRGVDVSTSRVHVLVEDCQTRVLSPSTMKVRDVTKAARTTSGTPTRSTVRRRRKATGEQRELPLPAPKPRMEWGGVRPGAGRRRTLVHDPVHVARPEHKERHPSHINMRVVAEVGRLRRRKQWQVFRRVALRAGDSDAFRVVHLSIQSNHIHLIVEGASAEAIARGMQRFASMTAKALNRLLGRKGKVFAHRYHRVDITSPRQMRNALAYVLNNWRRHR